MITFHPPNEPGLELTDHAACPDLTARAIWIDLLQPTEEEENTLEKSLAIDVPTREEMQEIELSSRLYTENGVRFMTGTVVLADTSRPESAAITFILSPERLVTVRYADPLPFRSFRAEREKHLQKYATAQEILAGLIDAIVDRVADILEQIGTGLDQVSLDVFATTEPTAATSKADRAAGTVTSGPAVQSDFSGVLRRVGTLSDLISRARESLVSFGRLVAYFRETEEENAGAQPAAAHLRTIVGDLSSLSDHATFLSGKVGFLLDATLGMIANEQNAIIKIISVAAVVFLPPTLVAGIYGMNFHAFPELSWRYGYAFALLLMAISSVLPYFYFKRKGWL